MKLESFCHANFKECTFTDIFDIEEIQKLQNLFSDVNEVAAIITKPDGTPITEPSKFSEFCNIFIRNTEIGRCNCNKSEAEIVRLKTDGPTVKKCLSVGLWGAGVSIIIGEKHIANWLIGQVKSEDDNENNVLKYASEIGVDRKEFMEAYNEVPVMSAKKFAKIADLLFAFVKEIADKAYKNLLLKQEAKEKDKAIRQRIAKEEELLHVNEEIKLILENLPNIIWKTDINADGSFVNEFISDIADEVLGVPKGTIDNSFEKYFSYSVPECRPKVREIIALGVANPGQIYSSTYRVKKANGDIAWLESTGRGFLIENRLQMFGISVDVTEQKRTQDRLNESEERYKSLLANLPVGVFRSNIEGKVLSANQAMAEMYGYSSVDELLCVPAKDYYSNKTPRKTMLKELKENGYMLDYETLERRKDGVLIWVSANYRLVDELHIEGVLIDITERKKTEMELVKSRERYELAMQVTLDGPWDWNLITNEIYYSPRWKEILGYKPDELPDDYSVWEKLTAPEDVKKSLELMDKHISGELARFEIESKMKHKNGHWVDILSRARAYFDENGKAYRVIGTHIDISESKKAEQQLKENEERFRKLTEHLPNGIAIYSPIKNGSDFQFVDINKAAEEITHVKREDIVGSFLLAKFPNMVNSPLFKALKKVNATGKDEFIPSFYYKDSMREGWRENYIYKLQTGELVTIFRDTTEIKNAEQNLIKQNTELIKAKLNAEQNEKRFKVLLDATFGGIAIHDKGIILDCNQGLVKLSGLERNELIGSDGLMLIAERFRKKVMQRIDNDYEKPYEAIAVRRNGEEYPVRMEGRVIPYYGKFVRVVEFRDITEIKKTEHELITAKEKAEESDRLKSAFLANMSHEIRTPMNGILGFTDLLQEPNLSGEEQHRYIDIIQQSGDRLLQTVNDIIEVSKIETGQVSVSLKEVNLSEMLEYLYDFFIPEVEKKGMQLYVNNELSLEESSIKTDRVKLSSILTNLIKNAIKYSEKGTVIIVCERQGNKLKFSIKDEGIGIPKNRLKAVFERFIQADIEDKNVHEGSGLGLAITKSYAEMLGGKVWVESQEGKGSVFYVTIDYNPIHDVETIGEMSGSEIVQENLKQTQILVAEDDAVSFMLLEGILSNENVRLIQAKNGKEAIEQVKARPDIDLILMDIKMPQMGGIEATQIIRSFNTTIPIIAQTAYALEGDKENALKAGCNDYISKPINKKTLLEMIKRSVKK